MHETRRPNRPQGQPIDPRRIFILVRQFLELDDAEVIAAFAAAGREVSRSQVQGWKRGARDLHWPDLEAFLDGQHALFAADGAA
jgi:hypothetical protein